MLGGRGQLAQLHLSPLAAQPIRRFPHRHGKELGVVFFLVEHRHKPVLQRQVTRPHDLEAVGVVVELGLPRQHGIAHPLTLRQAGVKPLHKTAGGFYQHRVAHGHHRADPFF